MAREMTVKHVVTLPPCVLCQMEGKLGVRARFDSPVDGGRWGYLCDGHMAAHGSPGLACRLSDEPEPAVSLKGLRAQVREAIEEGDFFLAEDLIGDGDLVDFL